MTGSIRQYGHGTMSLCQCGMFKRKWRQFCAIRPSSVSFQQERQSKFQHAQCQTLPRTFVYARGKGREHNITTSRTVILRARIRVCGWVMPAVQKSTGIVLQCIVAPDFRIRRLKNVRLAHRGALWNQVLGPIRFQNQWSHDLTHGSNRMTCQPHCLFDAGLNGRIGSGDPH